MNSFRARILHSPCTNKAYDWPIIISSLCNITARDLKHRIIPTDLLYDLGKVQFELGNYDNCIEILTSRINWSLITNELELDGETYKDSLYLLLIATSQGKNIHETWKIAEECINNSQQQGIKDAFVMCNAYVLASCLNYT